MSCIAIALAKKVQPLVWGSNLRRICCHWSWMRLLRMTGCCGAKMLRYKKLYKSMRWDLVATRTTHIGSQVLHHGDPLSMSIAWYWPWPCHSQNPMITACRSTNLSPVGRWDLCWLGSLTRYCCSSHFLGVKSTTGRQSGAAAVTIQGGEEVLLPLLKSALLLCQHFLVRHTSCGYNRLLLQAVHDKMQSSIVPGGSL